MDNADLLWRRMEDIVINRFVIFGLVISQSLLIYAADDVLAEERKAVSRAINACKEDLTKLRSVLTSQTTEQLTSEVKKNVADLTKKLNNDFFYLKAALGSTSKVRAGAATVIFNDLVKKPNLFKRFDELGKFNTIEAVLNQIENYQGSDDLLDDFNIVPEKGGAEMTASILHKPLTAAVQNLVQAIKETRISLKKGGIIQISTKIAPAKQIIAPPALPEGKKTKKAKEFVTLLDWQLDKIDSWPDSAKNAKTSALQLLAAYAYSQWSTGIGIGKNLTQAERDTKLGESTRVLTELYTLNAPVFAVREVRGALQKVYVIDGLGTLSAQQLHDYAKEGKGNILYGLCEAPSTKMVEAEIVDRSDFKTQEEIDSLKWYVRIYRICSNLNSDKSVDQDKELRIQNYEKIIADFENKAAPSTVIAAIAARNILPQQPAAMPPTTAITTTTVPTTTTTTTPAAPPTLPITPTPRPPATSAPATLPTATTTPIIQPKPQPVTTTPQPTVPTAQPKPTPTPRGFFATVWDSAWNAATAVITAPFRLVTYVFNGIWSFFGGR